MTDELEKLRAEERDIAPKIDRAHRAERILNEDLFRDAIQELRDGAVNRLTHADVGDIETLRLARLEYDALEKIIDKLTAHVRDGQIAEKDLAQIKARKSWLSRLKGAA